MIGNGPLVGTVTVTRPELARTLAASVRSPLDVEACRLLGLPAPPGVAVHTGVFVLETHPYASVHLGAEGMIGGDAGDRVAGFWRALGMVPPPEADHLGTLLDLYARLGDEELALSRADRRRAAVASARGALLWEHLAPWVPVYLATVDRVGDGFHAAWASLAAGVVSAEADALAPRAELPTALVVAPPPLTVASRRELVDAVLAPVRSGVVVTQADLSRAGRDLGLGVRRGERRFALEGLLDQDPAAVLAWLAALAAEWSDLHRHWHCGALEPVGRWWAARARASAAALGAAAHAPVSG